MKSKLDKSQAHFEETKNSIRPLLDHIIDSFMNCQERLVEGKIRTVDEVSTTITQIF